MTTELARHVDTIAHALFAMRDLCDDPSTVAFDDVREPFEKLEAVLRTKPLLDAFFAFVAERDDAGRLVGSKWAKTYLEKNLGIEPGDAYDRLARGRAFFGEPDVEEPAQEGGSAEGSEDGTDGGFEFFGFGSDEEERQREERQREEERQRKEARERQARARKAAAQVSEKKQRVIRLELDRLVQEAKGAHARLMARAMDEAPNRSVNDLRAMVRRWVEAENRKHADPTNPNAGMRKRKLVIGTQNSDGTVDADITFTGGHAALFKSVTDKGLVPNSNLPEGEEDYRTPAQRRYDQLIAILEHYDRCQKPTEGGCASVVVSCTLDQLADADATTKFATNTGIDVTAFDLVRLGMDGTADFVLTVDGAELVPLNLYRTRRTASIAQRITLLAVQGVCAWAGCTAPLTECEAHHVVSWLRGGNTDIGNLAALCRQHHRMNNDNMNHRGNTSHIDICPTTRRAGLKEPGSPQLKFNAADAAEYSAVNLLRSRASHRHHKPHQPPEQSPDPPPPRQPAEAPPWARGQDPYPPF